MVKFVKFVFHKFNLLNSFSVFPEYNREMSTCRFLAASHAHTHNSTPYYKRTARARPITYARPRKFRATKKPTRVLLSLESQSFLHAWGARAHQHQSEMALTFSFHNRKGARERERSRRLNALLGGWVFWRNSERTHTHRAFCAVNE